ncbi:hypothetical protein SteCoe_25637 [Stentor coeruleus]|uniref:TOG domain-containing protein n=1 Tax=Stentor coeruleus TaxID=5963 RepID=A0A1R2BER5_9CILI|nr:hypothetical protein SteCoe_25637 [Stentor coeruleus]
MTMWLSSNSVTLKLFSLYLFEISTENNEIALIINQNAESVFQLMWNSLQVDNYKIKAAACRTTCIVLAVINEKENFRQVFSIIIDLIQSLPVEEMAKVFNAISELIDNSPRIIIGAVDKLSKVIIEICKTTTVPYAARIEGLQVIHAVMQRAFDYVKGNTLFIQEIITLSLILLSEIEYSNDLAAWDADTYSDTDAADNIFTLGKELLCTITELFTDLAYQHLIILIEAHINAAHWLHKHTGIIALGIIACDCASAMHSKLDYFIHILITLSSHEHPRIRWACITSIAYFCTAFAPIVQNKHTQTIVSILIENMKLENLNKLKIQALKCMANFAKPLHKAKEIQMISPFISNIFNSFYELFTNSSTTPQVLNEVLMTLASVSMTSKTFSSYFSLFLPSLQALFKNGLPANVPLKNSALICLSCFARQAETTVVETILADALRLKSIITIEDECYNTLLEVIVGCLENVGGYHIDICNALIKELLSNAATNIETLSSSLNSNRNSFGSISIEIRGSCEKNLKISTGAFETKLISCKLIFVLFKFNGQSLQNWIPQTLETMLNLAFYPFNKDIRKWGIKIIEKLPTICDLVQRNSIILSILTYFINKIKEKIYTFPEDIQKILSATIRIIKIAENLNFIGLPGAQTLSEVLAENIKAVFIRGKKRKEIFSKTSDKMLLQDEPKNLSEFENIDIQILRSSVDLIGLLLKSFKTDFLKIFQTYFQTLLGGLLYDPESTDDEIISSLCLFCDYIEYTGDLLFNQDSSLILSALVKLAYHPNPAIRQCAAYGIGLGATYGNPQVFIIHQTQCVDACKNILANPQALTEDLIECTECAAGSIGKIALKYSEDLIPIWIQYLPFKSDPNEACVAHDLFIRNFNRISRYPNAYSTLEHIKNSSTGYVLKESLDLL